MILPAPDTEYFRVPNPVRLQGPASKHPPRTLLLRGSLRHRSYSRFLADEAVRLLIAMGCETWRFDPADLPLPDAMVTIPDQSSVPKAFERFDAAGRLPAGSHDERLVDVCEGLVRFTWLIRDNAGVLVDRDSEGMERAGRKQHGA